MPMVGGGWYVYDTGPNYDPVNHAPCLVGSVSTGTSTVLFIGSINCTARKCLVLCLNKADDFLRDTLVAGVFLHVFVYEMVENFFRNQ